MSVQHAARASGAGLLLAVLAAWALGPGLLDGSIVGGGEQPDWTGTVWSMWWFGAALRDGLPPWVASSNWAPSGQSPVGYFNLVEAALGAPLVLLLGPARGYSAACAFILWSTGMATAAAVRLLGGRWTGAVAAAAAVMLSPWLLLELTSGRLAQAWIAAPVLALAALARLRDHPTSRAAALLTGALVALSSLTYWFHGFFVLCAAAVFWLLPGKRTRSASLPDLARSGFAFTALCGIPAAVLMADLGGLPGIDRALPAALDHGPLGRGEFSLNMAIARSPGALWPMWSPNWEPADLRLPLSMLGLALVGALAPGPRPARLRWAMIVFVGWLLTLGPWLRGADGAPLPVPMPWLALHDVIPGFSRMWWPVRASVLAIPALAFLAARGADALSTRATAAPWLASLVASVFLIGEIVARGAYLPVPRGPGRPVQAEMYAQLDGTLLTTPVLGRSPDSRHLLWLQAHHERPVLAGLGDHLPAHVPPSHQRFVDDNSLLAMMHDLAWDRMEPATVDPDDVQELLDQGFRWAVVDPSAYRLGRAEAWARQHRTVFDTLFGPAAYESGGAAAWKITVPAAPVTLDPLPAVEPDLPAHEGIPVRIRRTRGHAPPRGLHPR